LPPLHSLLADQHTKATAISGAHQKLNSLQSLFAESLLLKEVKSIWKCEDDWSFFRSSGIPWTVPSSLTKGTAFQPVSGLIAIHDYRKKLC
jgi:hypothetical protein